MTVERLAAVAVLAGGMWLGAVAAEAAGPSARDPVIIGYVSLQDDPWYRSRPAYTGLVLRQAYPPLEGVRTAIRESGILGRALGLGFELMEITGSAADIAGRMQRAREDAGVAIFVLDLPRPAMLAVTERFAGADLVLFNPRLGHDDLRGAACAANLFHTIPSTAMLTDALAQLLRQRRWTRVLALHGDSEPDRLYVAAFQASADKFALDVVAVRAFDLSNDPRRRDRTNIPILTGGLDYDVLFLADSYGEFSRYVPYHTPRPHLVIGDEGLVPSAWHWTFERYGAPQLNQRFARRVGRSMTAVDWAGWAAVKAVVGALVEAGSTAPAALRRALTSADLALDVYKGVPAGFRPWDNQLRQPIVLHTHNAVVDLAPLEGYLHRDNSLDTLGVDRPETRCRLR